MSESEQQLDGVTVGVFVAPQGTEDVEFTDPQEAVSDAGATVEVLSTDADDEARTVDNDLEWSDSYEVDGTFDEASADDYDALIVPGGTVGADRLRLEESAVSLVEEHVANDRPIGVICHGPWMLVEADVVDGRTLTSFPSLKTDIRNAGGEWVDEEVVTDGPVTTSRKPDDLEAFSDRLIEEFAAEADG